MKLSSSRLLPAGLACVALAVAGSLPGDRAHANDYHLYYLGGQSNMDGYGQVDELPDELRQPIEGVMIFHGNTAPDGQPEDGRGVWSALRPGHGVGFSSDGQTND